MTQIKDDNGNWVVVAGGQRTWVGTKAALQTALNNDEIPNGTPIMVTDDYAEGTEIVDAVENGNMKAVTSNAVAKILSIESHTKLATSLPANTGVAVAQITVPKGKWIAIGQVRTEVYSSEDNLLSISIAGGTVDAMVDQRRQVLGIWGYAHGMVCINITADTGPITLKATSNFSNDVQEVYLVAIKVAE